MSSPYAGIPCTLPWGSGSTPVRADRPDAYWDGYHLPDYDGCEHHDHCLTCPFADCIKTLEGIEIEIQTRNASLVEQIRELRDKGLSAQEVGVELGFSRRQIYRFLEQARRDGAFQ